MARKTLAPKDRAYLEQALRPFVLALRDLQEEAGRTTAAMNAVSDAYRAGRGITGRVAVDLDTGRIVELAPTPEAPAQVKPESRSPAPRKVS